MKRILFFLTIALVLSACATKNVVEHDNESQTTNNNSSTSVNHTVQIDTLANNSHQGTSTDDILNLVDTTKYANQISDLQATADSLTLANAMKDNRIKELMLKVATKSLTLAPIRLYESYAWAEAGLTNNKLWLNLHQNQILATSTHTDSTTVVNNSSVKETNHQKSVETKLPWWRNKDLIIAFVLGFGSCVVLRVARKLFGGSFKLTQA